MACKRSAVRSRLAPPIVWLVYVVILKKQYVGAIAQLGERLHGMQEVSGSIPLSSTKLMCKKTGFMPVFLRVYSYGITTEAQRKHY